MRNTFSGINIGASALNASRAAMDIVGHNIANAQTDEYSRQTALLENNVPTKLTIFNNQPYNGFIGQGVNIDTVLQNRDKFLDSKVRQERSNLAYHSESFSGIETIEYIVNELSENNIRGTMDEFYNAVNQLSENPEDFSVRTQLKEQALTLAETIRTTSTSLSDFQDDMNEKVNELTNEMNRLAENIVQINKRIATSFPDTGNPNDLIDERERELKKLSEIVDIRVEYTERFQVNVSIGASEFIRGDDYIPFSTFRNDENLDMYDVRPAYKNTLSNVGPEILTLHSDTSVRSHNFTLVIDQLATKREIETLEFDNKVVPLNGVNSIVPANPMGTTSGRFTLDGEEFYVDVSKDSLNDVVDMINQADLQVKASLIESGTGFRMHLESRLTGTDQNSIILGNQNDSSNLLFQLGLLDSAAGPLANGYDASGDGILQADPLRFVDAVNSDFTLDQVRYSDATGNAFQKNTIEDLFPGVTFTMKGLYQKPDPADPDPANPTLPLVNGTVNFGVQSYVQTGELKAVMDMRDEMLPRLLDQLDEYTYTFVSRFNEIHREGFGLDGSTQQNFFKEIDSSDPNNVYSKASEKIYVADSVIEQPITIAAGLGKLVPTSLLPEAPGEGNTENAFRLLETRDEKLFKSGTANIGEFYASVISELGSKGRTEEAYTQNFELVLKNLDSRRQEVMGVSLDEEMSNLIMFQHSYQAAARFISVNDQMLDTLINRLF